MGFDRGLSTISLAYKNRGDVFGIDWVEEESYASKCFALDSGFRNISNALRLHYAKNIHLIVGPFLEIAKTWRRRINILHINEAPSYDRIKERFESWSCYLEPNAVILVHEVLGKKEGAKRFFSEITLPKLLFRQSNGLGVFSQDEEIICKIRKTFS